jgi:hypothetical protein
VIAGSDPSQKEKPMAQATPSISRHTPLTLAQHMTMATMTRAMQLARYIFTAYPKK